MKRLFDAAAALLGLAILSPLLALLCLAIWLQDFRSPLYIADRACRGGAFRMVKLRSMVIRADKLGGTSTAGTDQRITPVGHFIRRFKLDELSQLWNVFTGSMSLVGPRPQALPDAALYTAAEKRILTVKPGITDLSSIVFADEGSILAGAPDPDLRYNQIIRPWKSRLALLYVDHHSFLCDLEIIALTLIALLSRPAALAGVQRILLRWRADPAVCATARRNQPLMGFPLPDEV